MIETFKKHVCTCPHTHTHTHTHWKWKNLWFQFQKKFKNQRTSISSFLLILRFKKKKKALQLWFLQKMSKNFGFPHNNMQGIGSSTEGYLTGSHIFWKPWSYIRIGSQKFGNHGYMSESVTQFFKIHGYIYIYIYIYALDDLDENRQCHFPRWKRACPLLLVTTSIKVHSECIWEEHFTKLRTREAFYLFCFLKWLASYFFPVIPAGYLPDTLWVSRGGKKKNLNHWFFTTCNAQGHGYFWNWAWLNSTSHEPLFW